MGLPPRPSFLVTVILADRRNRCNSRSVALSRFSKAFNCDWNRSTLARDRLMSACSMIRRNSARSRNISRKLASFLGSGFTIERATISRAWDSSFHNSTSIACRLGLVTLTGSILWTVRDNSAIALS